MQTLVVMVIALDQAERAAWNRVAFDIPTSPMLEFYGAEELVEVTPLSVRLRKRYLTEVER